MLGVNIYLSYIFILKGFTVGAYVIVFTCKSMCLWVYERHAERAIGSISTGHFSTSKIRVWVWWDSFCHRNKGLEPFLSMWRSPESLIFLFSLAVSRQRAVMQVKGTSPQHPQHPPRWSRQAEGQTYFNVPSTCSGQMGRLIVVTIHMYTCECLYLYHAVFHHTSSMRTTLQDKYKKAAVPKSV